jgi:hypothetical protein
MHRWPHRRAPHEARREGRGWSASEMAAVAVVGSPVVPALASPPQLAHAGRMQRPDLNCAARLQQGKRTAPLAGRCAFV